MKIPRIIIILLVLFFLFSLYPVICITLGRTPAWWLTPITTLIGFTFALLHSSLRSGWKKSLLLLGSVFFISLLFESVGVATGLVYGPYHYTDRLGPLFLGLVPYLIPVAWFMMSYASLVMAEWLVPSRWGRWPRLLGVAALGGLAMTAWDTVMDPIMVAGGHWVWEVKGAYSGIPLQNFWGWWLTVLVSLVVYQLLAGTSPLPANGKPDRLAVLLYLITGAGVISTSLLVGMGGTALTGLFAMLPWTMLGWMRMGETGGFKKVV